MGHFDLDELDRFIILRDKKGNLCDNRNSRVNRRGYLCNTNGDIINNRNEIVIPAI